MQGISLATCYVSNRSVVWLTFLVLQIQRASISAERQSVQGRFYVKTKTIRILLPYLKLPVVTLLQAEPQEATAPKQTAVKLNSEQRNFSSSSAAPAPCCPSTHLCFHVCYRITGQQDAPQKGGGPVK